MPDQKISWLRYQPKEIEKLIVKFAKQGKTSAEIGLLLRDSYGIPKTKEITGKRIQQIIKDSGLSFELPEHLVRVIKRYLKEKKHLERHKHDYKTKRALEISLSEINRLVSYYKKKKVLPLTWKFDPEQVSLLLK